jgi:cytochrome c oxidase subunit 2
LLALVVSAGAAAACGGPASTLDPQGPAARQIAALTWLLAGVAGAIHVLVLVLLVRAARRRRDARIASDRRAMLGVVAGGVVLPVVVLTALFVASVETLRSLTRPAAPGLVVEVIAHQFWWELRYAVPGAEAMVTANELHVPRGERVELRLRSLDVIHSFWVPVLHGKLDLIPRRPSTTWIRADREGVYHGHCAEYCGVQHALMRLLVVVQSPAEFAAWLAAQRRPAEVAADEALQGAQALFFMHCAHCHTVRGTAAFFGRTGPDLTHLASRRTLAAGTLANAAGNLASWVADPQALKPGNRMPRIPLRPDERQALLDYLGRLR